MTLLVLGLILWTAAHLLKPAAPGLRAQADGGTRCRSGPRCDGRSSSARGLVLMIIGYRGAPYVPVYDPPPWGDPPQQPADARRRGAVRRRRIRRGGRARWLRHPMLTGVVVWAVAHLLVNGDQASLVLFGWMGALGARQMLLIDPREPAWVRPGARPGLRRPAAPA